MNMNVNTQGQIILIRDRNLTKHNFNSISVAKKGTSHVWFQSQKEKVENDIKIIMNNNRIQNI